MWNEILNYQLQKRTAKSQNWKLCRLIFAFYFSEFNYSFKWVDDQKYGKRNQETGEWNGMMGELLAQVSSLSIRGSQPFLVTQPLT